MNLYFYKSYVTYQEDKSFAQNIMQKIDNDGYDYRHKAIVFIGKYASGQAKESWGPAVGSFFNWDGGNITRMTDFLYAEGYAVTKPSTMQIEHALVLSKSMPSWPELGCIAQDDDFLVVKFSEIKEGSMWYRINGVNR